MRIVSSVAAMQRLSLRLKRQGKRIGFVPTMGYLHEGHISLVKRARQAVSTRGLVVVSIYVNPTQFAPTEDLSRYPRDFNRDRKLCRDAGVDVIFFPKDAEMYPGKETGGYSTYVVEERLTRGMEGASRPTHFRGVTTIVAKLFNIVLPDVAVFGAKDYQQAAVLSRMVHDLNFPLKMIIAPTHREKDGLAMSSRNKYLNESQRKQALALSEAIRAARGVVKSSRKPLHSGELKLKLKGEIESQPEARVDYIEFFDPETLESVPKVRTGVHMALAVFVGPTRLIDNGPI